MFSKHCRGLTLNNNNNNNNNLYLHYSGRVKKRTNIENKIIENL